MAVKQGRKAERKAKNLASKPLSSDKSNQVRGGKSKPPTLTLKKGKNNSME